MGEQLLLILETQGEITSEKWWALEGWESKEMDLPLQLPGECNQIPPGNSDLQSVS